MENVTLNVSGMSCGHCVNAVEGNVGKLAGVESVKVHLETGKVDVAFDKEKVSLEKIKETIDDQGYDVE
ncbi:copper chaperone CopZ [Peribacillus castrilensis]|jgi:copper chaperone|uniref:Copper chaperone CopZ n=1 Tax=Peribacillus simplex TaxID=1478 RepID=A0AAN2PII2_9BACI|nr:MULTISPECIES: copper chaperone CopZ [Bacillaceae]MBL3645044.1 copper chaperone CopZ [Bacillus sp. RHFB]MCP1096822.1 copper chaperone CopZ [Bacillaceae bacterium OS4b]MEC0344929.1 copper chaperone CopZ [Peribacillus castrilensis]MBD8591567.1 copper chaperone CopZ [Peribacillus simplex]MCF7622233.1 copper chaperone CopZ [Peribacillus frigoritolerans]